MEKVASTFLDRDEVQVLTGRRMKSLQVEQLRTMGIAFHVNALGHPVVPRSAIEGKPAAKPKEPKPAWRPAVLGNG